MARRNSAQKAKTALKKAQRKRARRGPIGLAYQAKLQKASDCLLDGDLDEAHEILEELDDRYPDQPRILETLLELHWLEDDYYAYYVTARRLLQLDASDPQAHLRMGGCFERHDASAAALLHFREYLKRTNSSDPLAEQVRKTVARMSTSSS